MIPKIIHYCWFGRKPLPKSVLKYIQTWREKCPDYEILEWNESNFDVNSFQFTLEAYKVKKYAFVADVARLYALNSKGGIYLDTDVEVVKSFDPFLNSNSFISFESNDRIGTAVIGAELGSSFINDCLKYYEGKHFILDNNIFDTTANTNIISNHLIRKGLVLNNTYQFINQYVDVYPRTYFSAKIFETGEMEVSDRTYAIHNFDGSWLTNYQKIRNYIKIKCPKLFNLISYIHSWVRKSN